MAHIDTSGFRTAASGLARWLYLPGCLLMGGVWVVVACAKLTQGTAFVDLLHLGPDATIVVAFAVIAFELTLGCCLILDVARTAVAAGSAMISERIGRRPRFRRWAATSAAFLTLLSPPG